MPKSRPELDLRLLETLCCVIEERSFTRAAERLLRSQASISERIAALEKDLGVPLLDRLGREVRATAAGRELHERGRALLAQHEHLRRDMASLVRGGGGEVTLGASTVPGEYVLPPLLAKFFAKHAGHRVSLRIADTGAILDDMAARRLDLGLVGFPGKHPGLRLRPLWRDELVLAVPANHRLAGRRRISADLLAGETLLFREERSGTRRSLERTLTASGVDVTALEPRAVLGSTAAVKQGVLAGLGISFLSRHAVETERRMGLLALVTLSGVDLERWIYLVDDPKRSLAPSAEELRRFLVASKEG